MLFLKLHILFTFLSLVTSLQPALVFAQTTTQTSNEENPSLQKQIIISEVYPQPNPEESEWIELYNPNVTPVDITDWSLYEHISSTKILTKFVSKDENPVLINANSFFIYELESNKLNNSEETVTLHNSDFEVIDELSYKNSIYEQSFNKEITLEKNNSETTYLAIPSKNNFNTPQAVEETPTTETTVASSDKDQTEKQKSLDINEKDIQKDTDTKKDSKNISNNITPVINPVYQKYIALENELRSIPNIEEIRSEKIQPRESKFSYLIQKHVSAHDVLSAIIGGSLLLLTGFLL